ncbi:MAG: ABC transporter permease [Defluviitaleaceae bacterium]|nr:ABC transporter permease [Defluviitaleaceae bacterium]MCL2239685.1 ABC transporter permease [Defluviitaleaceae bacterium]
MKQMMTVFGFEFKTFAKSGAFIGITIFMVVLALIGPAIPRVIQFFGDMDIGGERRIAVVDHTGHFAHRVGTYVSPTAGMFRTIEDARAAVADGDYHYAVSIHEDSFTLYITAMGVGALNLENSIALMLRDHHRYTAFADLGIVPAQQEAIFAFFPRSEVMTLSPAGEITEDTAEDFFTNMIFSYVLSFVLYFGLLTGGSYIVTTVVREKSTKTMELLITSCKAGRLMNGKVLGVAAAVLTQILLMVGAAALSMNLFGGLETEGVLGMLDLTFDPYIMGMLVIFFFLGFIMYAFMYAALASTVSRMEDANSIQTLPMMLVMVGFFAAIFGMTNPGALWINVLSHIPLFAPFVMFMRICLGTAALWEVAVSIAAQVATIAVVAFAGGRIYRMGTLMYGNKPRLRDLLAAFR